MIKQKIKKHHDNHMMILSVIMITLFILFPLVTTCFTLIDYRNQISPINKNDNLNTSSAWGWVNLTNEEIDNEIFKHYDYNLTVEGRLFHLPTGTGYDGYKVSIKIDGQVYSQFNNITANGGFFIINNYTIPGYMNVYTSHTIEVEVDTSNTITYMNSFTFNLNSTSHFDMTGVDISKPYLRGENLDTSGILKYDNDTGIPNANFNVNWYTGLGTLVSSNIYSTTATGAMPNNMFIPEVPASLNNMTVELTYSDSPYVGYSFYNSSKFLVFDNVSFIGLSSYDGDANSTYTITGQVRSRSAPNYYIFNRYVRVVYNGGERTAIAQTLANGSFSLSFKIPPFHNGSYSYYIELINSAGKTLVSNNVVINVNPLEIPLGEDLGGQPGAFIGFLIIFIPIISVIAGVLILYGYFFLKKQREGAQVATIPLEGKIKNLKILKDSGRMEESLSYLFNAIYITLVDAKYGRRKKEYETIRDFAIISVKELRMKPSVIYPFITKVEEIIYSRPFEITDDDFHSVVDLFSRVYFELTNHNFILNF
ncbi:MAG: hypothetical protein ACFFBP_11140 [Promethearchaeota archaeon]